MKTIEKQTKTVKTVDLFNERGWGGGGTLKESTVFTIFVCLPTACIMVFKTVHSFHTFCSILGRLFFLWLLREALGMVLVQHAPRRSSSGEAGRMVHCTRGVLGAFHWVDGEKRRTDRECVGCVWRGERRRGETQ